MLSLSISVHCMRNAVHRDENILLDIHWITRGANVHQRRPEYQSVLRDELLFTSAVLMDSYYFDSVHHFLYDA